MNDLATSKRLAVITGASSGIGAATASVLAADGYRVILIGRRTPALEEVAAGIGDAAVVEPCDAGDGDAVLALAERIKREHGIPDVIVNSAGAGEWKRIEDTSPAETVSMMSAPYFAAFFVTHAFMREMLERNSGVIIHVNSPVSLFTWPNCVGYAATRFALRGMHEALVDDLYTTRVRSCNVVFAKVASPYFETNESAADKVPGAAKTVRTLTPEECAKVIGRVVRRPRDQVVYPFMLRFYYWTFLVAPGLVRWLMRRTGYIPAELKRRRAY